MRVKGLQIINLLADADKVNRQRLIASFGGNSQQNAALGRSVKLCDDQTC